jgi:DNA-binding transcriptional MocR family regulator
VPLLLLLLLLLLINVQSQVMIHQLLTKWGRQGFEGFVTQLQQRYARNAAVAEAAAAQHLTGLAEWQPAAAGMFMWLKMTGGLRLDSN